MLNSPRLPLHWSPPIPIREADHPVLEDHTYTAGQLILHQYLEKDACISPFFAPSVTVPVSAHWMDCTDCICMNRDFNMTVYLHGGQLLDSAALSRLLSALSCVSWSCNPRFTNPFARAASCERRGCDSRNTNIYPDSPGLTCVLSVSGGVVVHTHALPACV